VTVAVLHSITVNSESSSVDEVWAAGTNEISGAVRFCDKPEYSITHFVRLLSLYGCYCLQSSSR